MDSKKAPEETPETASDSLSFEEGLERIEGIVDRLEQGDLELEDALATFEKGVGLMRRCAGQLDDAERRIEVLVKDGEKWLTRTFQVDAEEGGESDRENTD